VNLAPCLQDAAPPAGCSVLSAAPVRRWDLAKWAVEERLPLVAKSRATSLAVFRVRPGSAYGRRLPE
jgi:class 3 adenylate cyclase